MSFDNLSAEDQRMIRRESLSDLGKDSVRAILGDGNTVEWPGSKIYLQVREVNGTDENGDIQYGVAYPVLSGDANVPMKMGTGVIVGKGVDGLSQILGSDRAQYVVDGGNPRVTNPLDPYNKFVELQYATIGYSTGISSSTSKTMECTVYPLWYINADGVSKTFGHNEDGKFDFTSDIPAADGDGNTTHCVVGLFLNSSNVLESVASTEKVLDIFLDYSDVAEIIAARSARALPIRFYKLQTGQTQLAASDEFGDGREWITAPKRKNNYTAIIPPTVDDDIDLGYEVGSRWLDTVDDRLYECLDSADGAAIWKSFLTEDDFNDNPRFGLVVTYDGTQQTTIAFDGTNTFTLAPTATTWEYWRNGIKYTITGSKTVVLSGSPPAAKGLYYIYIDAVDGTLTASTTGWTLEATKVPIATVDWDNALTPNHWLANERHSVLIDRRYHWEHHFSDGTEMITTPTLSGYTVAPPAPSDTDNTFAISAGVAADEDIKIVLSSLADGDGIATNYHIRYRNGASLWDWEKSIMPYRYTAAGYIQYDNAGTMTQGANNKYYNTYLLVTNDIGDARFATIPGQAEHSSLTTALGEDFGGLTKTGLNIPEFVAIYQLTWSTSAAYSTLGKCRLAREPIAISTSASGASSPVALVHNELTGKQGGTTDEYYHLTLAESTSVSGVDGDDYELNEVADLTTSSTSFADVDSTGFSLTITTTGGPVLIGFAGSITGDTVNMPVYFNIWESVAAADLVANDGIMVSTILVTGRAYNASFTWRVAGLTAGAHTFRLRWKVSNVATTATMWAGDGTAGTDLHPKFWVQEVL